MLGAKSSATTAPLAKGFTEICSDEAHVVSPGPKTLNVMLPVGLIAPKTLAVSRTRPPTGPDTAMDPVVDAWVVMVPAGSNSKAPMSPTEELAPGRGKPRWSVDAVHVPFSNAGLAVEIARVLVSPPL